MLHQAISKKKAIILLAFGWLYSAFIALLSLLMPHTNKDRSCLSPHDSFNKMAVTFGAVSLISLVGLVVTLQTATYWKLSKQQRMAIESGISNTGRNRMYRRAMITCSLVATCYLIGWLPLSISTLLYHWPNLDKETLAHLLKILPTLGIIQALCNPIIFKVRNSSMELKPWNCFNS